VSLVAPAVTRRLLEQFIQRPPPGRRADRLAALTERETEVLGLMARGWSNATIAEHLVVSETTVKTHVTRVLTKLGARDRVQAVVTAYETGLVVPGSPH
jgi:DNA-binding NarL/FixJ family response regulator